MWYHIIVESAIDKNNFSRSSIMSEKRNQQLNIVDELKGKLSKAISSFMANKKGESYSQADFARDVDKAMGLSIKWYQDQDERIKRAKNVSRWIHKDVFPSMELLIGISKVLGVSVNELFEGAFLGNSKTKELSYNSKKILEMLLSESNNSSKAVSLYFPYAFNGESLCPSERVFTRKEVVEVYKRLTTKKYQISRMNEFFQVLGGKDRVIQEKYFSRFCSCCILENEEDEIERISFDNTDACYERLQKVWEKINCKDVFNVLYFEEAEFSHSSEGFKEFGLSEMKKDKAAFYQNQAEMNKIYEQTFKELLDKKIIVPQEDAKLSFEYESGEFAFEMEEKNDKKFCYFLDVDGSMRGEYQLETIKFNFFVNLTKQEIKQFYQEELDRTFSEDE